MKGAGGWLLSPQGQVHLYQLGSGPGPALEAEYEALKGVLELAHAHSVTHLAIQGDCELLIHQIKGKARVPPGVKIIHAYCCQLLRGFDSLHLTWVSRKENTRANILATAACSKPHQKERLTPRILPQLTVHGTPVQGIWLVKAEQTIDRYFAVDLRAPSCSCPLGRQAIICRHREAVILHIDQQLSKKLERQARKKTKDNRLKSNR